MGESNVRASCCLSLRTCTAIIGFITLIVDILILVKGHSVLHRENLSGLDTIVLVYFALGEIPEDLVLIVGSWKENPVWFESHDKIKHAWSNCYTILLLLFCDRAWDHSGEVWKAVGIYIAYVIFANSYFRFVTTQYVTELKKRDSVDDNNQNSTPTASV